MDKQQATQTIEKVLKESKIGVLSTAYNNKPNSRYMVFYNDGLDLYTKTSTKTTKVDEIENNPNAYILLGYNETTNNSFVEIEATMEIVKDQKVIDWLWETQDKTFFDSKEDPDLCVLKVNPKTITLMNDDKIDTPVTIEL
ncbi:pyridoxamine 5'-phosphate oxidase family protein [Staphylococcus sp. NRL 16/872]|uniref:pyridoxamine 5'-phosphate oxidase family protein n=1 Tax=Staphylococcus sp. NRL 16/872 TaxID=2930131 RepID=UPI001FB50A61|nr:MULTISPECIES: pyridoxamine 5'-phosphate oxidase family protein [unclassified Staphylococcus]MCJ1655682.1 pyridoxamine 5'-phosphate oxidase family protein [Staphylococcus sp. NRL 21/187]MCJ1661500.1 pyridoxamine 5'-phosphate oxidase family protein [Staphylococcus sp. NRL 18/288]MCJ1667411.1 pyridoxamine 5'-phosphate oxidase family protein [Staphylococcus sp. NRL 19/737]WEN69893.1 pyridoxamine 5'-phosphate oxidase family protein [Staphylococcus sp. NRL 16/872]